MGDLALDIAPAGLGRLSKALGGGKTLIEMASETKSVKSVAAVIDMKVAAYSVGMGVKDTTELLFKPSQSSKNNPKTFSDRKQRPKK